MEDVPLHSFFISSTSSAKITCWNVAPGDKVRRGTVILSYSLTETTPSLQSDSVQSNCHTDGSTQQLKSTLVGIVKETLYKEGEVIPPSAPVVSIDKKCDHSVVVRDLCTDCGLNLRKGKSGPHPRPGAPTSDRISMVHGIPEIQISREEAEVLANKDKSRLLQSRKLALIIDLDQTLIHTSVDPNIEPGLPDVYGFRLPGHPMLYHCRLRPHTRQFLLNVSKYYETHVFTMGTKLYAASVTRILDPDKKLFYGRIISRDDCFDPHSKALRLKSVFPCGDAMVAIIDDREDVWGRCPNLIHVKPYVFFAGTADINAPPGSRSTPSRPQQNTSHSTPPTSTQPPQSPPSTSISSKTEASTPPSQTNTLNKTNVPETTREDNSTADRSTESPDRKCQSQPASNQPAESSSSSDTSSDSEDSSSSSSSDVDDTLFDNLGSTPPEVSQGSSPTEPPPSESNGNREVQELVEQGGAEQTAQTENETAVTGTESAFSTKNENTAEMETAVSTENETTVTGTESSISTAAVIGIETRVSAGNETAAYGTKASENESAVTGTESSISTAAMIGIKTGVPACNEATVCGTKASDLTEKETAVTGTESSAAVIGIETGVSTNNDTAACGTKASSLTENETATTGKETDQTGIKPATPAEAMETEPSNDQEVVLPTEVPSTKTDKAKKIDDPDNFLLHLSDILENVHKLFYSEYDQMASQSGKLATPDLKQIIPKIRQSVLRGAKILFTGVIPTNMPVEKSPEWNTARAFGASIHDRIVYGLSSSNPRKAMHATTHVVAGRPGTSKLREAKRIPGMKIVSPKWLWSCAEQWKLVDERGFPVKFEEDKVEKAPAAKVPKITTQRNRTGVKKETKSKTPKEEVEVFDDDVADPLSMIAEAPAVLRDESRVPERHMSIESCLSVSDEELERMNAEVDAEISGSSSSSSEEDTAELGTLIEAMDDDDSLSYDKFAGTNLSGKESRKRKHEDVSSSSENNSPLSHGLMDESLDVSDRDSSDSDSDDELAALLGNT